MTIHQRKRTWRSHVGLALMLVSLVVVIVGREDRRLPDWTAVVAFLAFAVGIVLRLLDVPDRPPKPHRPTMRVIYRLPGTAGVLSRWLSWLPGER